MKKQKKEMLNQTQEKSLVPHEQNKKPSQINIKIVKDFISGEKFRLLE